MNEKFKNKYLRPWTPEFWETPTTINIIIVGMVLIFLMPVVLKLFFVWVDFIRHF
jgi:hypothetical protein